MTELMFWNEAKNLAYTGKVDTKLPSRMFPSTSNVHHFHPIAWVRQMKLIAGTKLEEVLKEMKEIADSHIKYKQEYGVKYRTATTKVGLEKMDCSEFVCRYLHKLGVTKQIQSVDTSLMLTESNFRKHLKSDKIKFINGSDKADFIPEAGDIFVWRVSGSGGHTGIVYKYDESKDAVWILEAIGSRGAAFESERYSIKNGGYNGDDCTRTSIYKRITPALQQHKGWIGYYRPINY